MEKSKVLGHDHDSCVTRRALRPCHLESGSKEVVNATQMKPTYASCLCIYSAGINPWLRLKQFTRLFHLELYGAGCEGAIQLPPLRRSLNMALGATG